MEPSRGDFASQFPVAAAQFQKVEHGASRAKSPNRGLLSRLEAIQDSHHAGLQALPGG
jgi:hypothetical protein